MAEEKVFVLDGQVLEQFLAIKGAKGLTDAEVLKLIINWYYEEIKEKPSEKKG